MQNRYIEEATAQPKQIDLKKYYLAQTGGAIDPYISYHHLPHRGKGIFGDLIKGSILPLIQAVLPYFKDKAIEGVEGIISDVKEGVPLKEAGKRQLKRTASTVLQDVLKKKQKGSGVRKHKRRKTTKIFN